MSPEAPPELQSGGEFNKEFLLATIIYDLLWNVLHIGALAIALTACARGNTRLTLRPWRHLLHDNSKIMQLGLRYGPEIGLNEELCARTSKLYADVAVAKPPLAGLCKSAGSYSEPERRQLAGAAETWRRLAREARSILAEFNSGAIARVGGLLVEDARTLCQFLDEASAGNAKRISPNGEIALPALKQMRRSPRLKISGSCTLLVAGKSIAAELKDVAQSGLGIICRQPLLENQSLTVVMNDGRQLKAKIVNRQGDRIGLLFDLQLSSDDPLFGRAD